MAKWIKIWWAKPWAPFVLLVVGAIFQRLLGLQETKAILFFVLFICLAAIYLTYVQKNGTELSDGFKKFTAIWIAALLIVVTGTYIAISPTCDNPYESNRNDLARYAPICRALCLGAYGKTEC